MKRLKVKVFAPLVMLVFLASCATLGILSPKQQYLAARIEFNTMQKQYLDYYDKATPVQQTNWKVKVDPIFAKAEIALDIWGVAVKDGISADTQQQKFLDLKNQLIDTLVEVFNKGGK